MTRGRRVGNTWNTRIFKTASSSGLSELGDVGFKDEAQMHKMIENNIGTLFQDLVFLRAEFRDLDDGGHIQDTIAFDTRLRTFVVIEYKNRLDKEAVEQARAYLKYMREGKPALVLAYSKNRKCSPPDQKWFDWNMYAIVMAPEFSEKQFDAAADDIAMELYEIKRYGDGVLAVRRVGGGHEGAPVRSRKNPEPVPKPGAANLPYEDVCSRLIAEFSGMVQEKRKLYDRFIIGNQLLCTLGRQKSKIWLHYSKSDSNPAPDQPEFVEFNEVPGWGLGHWRSAIRSMADFERALPILKKLHVADSSESASPSPTRQVGGTRVFSDELLASALQPQSNRAIHTAVLSVTPPSAEDSRAVLTYGGIDAENRFCVLQQEVVPGTFSEVFEAVKRKQDQGKSIGFRGSVIVPVDADIGVRLLTDLLDGGISGCISFKRTDGRMDAAYGNLRTELETGRALLQDSNPSYRADLFEQLQGILWSDGGTMVETKGSNRAKSIAIAVWGARQTGGQNYQSGGGVGTAAGNKTKRTLPGRVRIRRPRF